MQSFYKGEGMSTAIGAAAANKQKNRFANIVACKFSTYQLCHYIDIASYLCTENNNRYATTILCV